MDLSMLLECHQTALFNIEEEPSHEARRWAEDCADYYGRRIVALRDRLDVPVQMFDHRKARA